MIDTHSHIYQPDFDSDIHDVVNRAKDAGITKILLPNIDVASLERVDGLAAKYPGYCIPMMGLHPTSVTRDWQHDLEIIKDHLSEREYIAVGEVGIDLYWDKLLESEQRLAFEEQLRWSIEFDLPVVIHSRDAIKESIECIDKVGADRLRGVFHSFGGSADELKEILNLKNFYLGINGVVTFKNSTLLEVLKTTDLTHIILETDSPYLSPVPYRGKRNESSYIAKVAEKLADIYGVSLAEVDRITTENAQKLFNIKN